MYFWIISNQGGKSETPCTPKKSWSTKSTSEVCGVRVEYVEYEWSTESRFFPLGENPRSAFLHRLNEIFLIVVSSIFDNSSALSDSNIQALETKAN
jgi:hypothetical protein